MTTVEQAKGGRTEPVTAEALGRELMETVVTVLGTPPGLLARLAAEGDQTTDPSQAWPAERELADLGTIEITAKDETREREADVLVHDPMRLVDGVEPSDDPILRIRPYVYAESIRRRTEG